MLALRSGRTLCFVSHRATSRAYSVANTTATRPWPRQNSSPVHRRDGERTQTRAGQAHARTTSPAGIEELEQMWVDPTDVKLFNILPHPGSAEESYLARTYRFRIQEHGVQSLEQTLVLKKAIEEKYGEIEEIRFGRDPDNRLAYMPIFFATFTKPLENLEEFSVELPVPTGKPGGPSLAEIQPFFTTRSESSSALVSNPATAAPGSSAEEGDSQQSPETITVIVDIDRGAIKWYTRSQKAPRPPGKETYLDFKRLWTIFGGFAPSPSPEATPRLYASLVEARETFAKEGGSLPPNPLLVQREERLKATAAAASASSTTTAPATASTAASSAALAAIAAIDARMQEIEERVLTKPSPETKRNTPQTPKGKPAAKGRIPLPLPLEPAVQSGIPLPAWKPLEFSRRSSSPSVSQAFLAPLTRRKANAKKLLTAAHPTTPTSTTDKPTTTASNKPTPPEDDSTSALANAAKIARRAADERRRADALVRARAIAEMAQRAAEAEAEGEAMRKVGEAVRVRADEAAAAAVKVQRERALKRKAERARLEEKEKEEGESGREAKEKEREEKEEKVKSVLRRIFGW